jgi:hypothetical protein
MSPEAPWGPRPSSSARSPSTRHRAPQSGHPLGRLSNADPYVVNYICTPREPPAVRTTDRNDAPPIHRALQAARKAAGFETAAAAASHFGWSLGRYRSHESGTRNIPDDDIRSYAKSFKVSMASLHTPDWKTIDRQLDRAREAAEKPKQAVARRLRCARILRGLASAIEASKAFGIGTPTYLKHENAGNAVNDTLIEFYANELSISRDWLSSGRLPSGLGAEVDGRIHQVLKDPEQFAGFAASSFRFGHRDEPAALDAGRPAGVVPIPEYRWSDLAECGGDISAATPSGVIQFPKASDQPSWPDDVISVLLDSANPYARPFSRIFVTRSLASYDDDAEYLAASDRQLAIVRLTASQLLKATGLLGRLVGKLEGST